MNTNIFTALITDYLHRILCFLVVGYFQLIFSFCLPLPLFPFTDNLINEGVYFYHLTYFYVRSNNAIRFDYK